MAVNFKIVGNFFNVSDTVTNEVFINDTLDSLKFYRSTTDVFSFYPKGAGSNNIEYTNLTKVGINQNDFIFADIIDNRTGLAFTSADALDLFLSENLGSLTQRVTGSTLEDRIIVNQSNYATTLGGTIDSTKDYFLDGIIDLGTTQITVPPSGMTITGYSFDISGLTSSEDNYTMFISESTIIGSGNLLGTDYLISVTGTNSKVYELYDATGFNAFEFQRVNFIDCTSLGDIYDYRQGLESGTGRFGGSPSLTLHGLWRGGYRITTSIVRSLARTMTEPLFKEGTLFQMNSRFLTDINLDLPTLAPFLDFSTVNFPNPSTLQLQGCIITRDGATVPNDSNITPNITASDLSCSWKGNNGIQNTFVGAIASLTTEIETGVTGGLPFIVLGTFTNTDMQHFDSPSNGQLRHLGTNPREYTVNFDFVLDGGSNNDYKMELVKDDGSTSVVYQQTRVINNLQGGRDVAYFTGLANVILNQNDKVYWQVTNITGNTNCTLELDSSWSVKER